MNYKIVIYALCGITLPLKKKLKYVQEIQNNLPTIIKKLKKQQIFRPQSFQ